MKRKKKNKIDPVAFDQRKIFIGIDNGVSGTIGIIHQNDSIFVKTPIKVEQSYTKAKGNISRIDVPVLIKILEPYLLCDVHCMIERPMVNPGRFKASASALRALEATLIVVEKLEYAHSYVDSKEWQKELLPKGIKGDTVLKKASEQIGCRLFPKHSDLIKKHKDADGILIAEHCRRKFH